MKLDAEIDLKLIESKLEHVIPKANVGPLKMLGDGFNSVVSETTDGRVIKVFKHEQPADRWQAVSELIDEIRPCVSTSLPTVGLSVEPSDEFPHTVIGFERVPGRTLEIDDLSGASNEAMAFDLAGFLLELHGCRIHCREIVRQLPSLNDWDSRMTDLRDSTLPVLKARMESSESKVIEDWWRRFLNDTRSRPPNPTLVHGDFWHENIMVDGKPLRLTGVLDFEDAHVGDPTQDFATLCHINPEFGTGVAESYVAQGGDLDPDWRFRMARLWELREFFGIRHSVTVNDQNELADSIRKLRQGPTMNRSMRLAE